MKNVWFVLLAGLSVAVLTSGCCKFRSDGNTTHHHAAKGSKLQEQLLGTWELVATKSWGATEFTPPGKDYYALKSFTRTHSNVTGYDPKTKAVVWTIGGPYTLKGNLYIETIEYSTGSRFVGAHPHFNIRIEGDKYYQTGVSNKPPIDEIWQRVKKTK